MRGLNTRALFVYGRILARADKEKGISIMKGALELAESEGYRDYRDGVLDVPSMFKDEPDLQQHWFLGQTEAISFEAHFLIPT